MLELGADGLDTSVVKVAYRSFGSLLRPPYRSSDPALDWLQVSFTAQESGAYLEGPIQTHRDTATQSPVLGLFQGGISIAALQRAFPGHYLSEPAESQASSPLGSTSTLPLGLLSPPTRVIPRSLSPPTLPGVPRPSLARLRGGAGGDDPSDDEHDGSAGG